MTIQTGLALSIFPNSALANGPAGNFSQTIPNGLDVSKGKWRVSLTFYQIWYSIPNVSVTKKNNQITYYDASVSQWLTLTFPTGGYQVSDICAYFTANVSASAAANIVFAPFLSTTTQLTLGSGYAVDFTTATNPASANMGALLGFNPLLYSTTGTTVAQNSANITGGLNSILFSFPGLIDQSFSYSGTSSNGTLVAGTTLYQGAFDVPFGFRQSSDIQNPLPFPIAKGTKIINTINVQITDQNGNILDFNQGGNYQNNASSFSLLFEQSASPDEKQIGW